jgi:TIGR03009 family protein
MRYLVMTLTGGLLCLAAAVAQPPQQKQVQPQPKGNQLDDVLISWEKVMVGLNSFVAECNETFVDKIFQVTKVSKGTAKYVKPNRASLEMYQVNKPGEFKKYVCNGKELYEYAADAKEIRIHTLTAPKAGQVSDDNFLTFLFGMKAADAKRRYQLTLQAPPPNDTWYHYIEVLPRDPSDKVDFTRARLVLLRSNYLPRQLWFLQPNGNEVTWDFPKVHPNAPVAENEFMRPTPPPGWQLRQVQPDVPPRVIRQQQ